MGPGFDIESKRAMPTRNTVKVVGRRTVRYENFNELLDEAERLATMRTTELGNWSKGQIYQHLAFALTAMLDGAPFSLPAPVRWVLGWIMKRRLLTQTLRPGFKLPRSAAQLLPGEVSTEAGLALLRAAVERVLATDQRAVNAVLGHLSKAESDQFQLRHCEMHMSFIIPSSE